MSDEQQRSKAIVGEQRRRKAIGEAMEAAGLRHSTISGMTGTLRSWEKFRGHSLERVEAAFREWATVANQSFLSTEQSVSIDVDEAWACIVAALFPEQSPTDANPG